MGYSYDIDVTKVNYGNRRPDIIIHRRGSDAKYNLLPEEGEKSRFIIRAPYSRWKEVIKKELDPVKGMMQGKLKLKGDLPTIVRYVKAANELVNLAQTVPTEFVDEQ